MPQDVPGSAETEAKTQQVTHELLDRLSRCPDPRLRHILCTLVERLHEFVADVELSEGEWLQGIAFLTRTGLACTPTRQEFILLSDVLAVSSLVNSLSHRRSETATESTILGPFYRESPPEFELGAEIVRDGEGDPALISCRVTDVAGEPVVGACVDVWQADGRGLYDVQRRNPADDLRGRFHTGQQGEFWFWTVKPVSYPVPTDGPVGDLLRAIESHPFRPAHIHFRITHAGFETLTTHLFVAGDPYLQSDAVFGMKPSLVVPFTARSAHPHEAADTPAEYWVCDHTFRLDRTEAPATKT